MGTDSLPTWSSHAYERADDPRSRILVAVTDGRRRRGDRTFLVVQGIQSWIETFEMQRFQLIARTLSARLVIVEVPGFGVAGSRLLPDERRALLTGDFGPLATRMFEAATSVLEDGGRDEPLSFLGYSMGASLASTMATVAATRRHDVEVLVLVEPVALHRWKLRELVAATRREDRWIADYVATNDLVPDAEGPWDQRPGVRPPTKRRRDLLVLGSALRHGGLAEQLLVLPTAPQHVIMVRGNRSALSEAAYAPILAALRQRGIDATELVVPGHHAFWHSLPAVAAMTQRVKDLLDGPD